MKRRAFLKLGAVAATLPAMKTFAQSSADGLPAWANAQIDEAVARYKAWKGADETVSLTLMTDVHSYLTVVPEKPLFSNSRYHTLFAYAAARRAGCDFMVDCGDHDYDNRKPSPEEALKRMAVTETLYRTFTEKPVLFAMGNHDHGPRTPGKTPAQTITSALFGDTFNAMAEKNGFKVVFGENRSWGYYDVPGKKFRAIFCNTSDEGYYGFSASQIAFVAQALERMPEGWTAALFGHFCVFAEIGHWKGGGAKIPRGDAFIALLQKFVKARPNALAGYFCGDSHYDNELEWRGVNWTVFQGYGGVSDQSLPWGARRLLFSRAKSMLFDIVAFKPAKGTFRIFRVGAGGAACDRTCLFHNAFPPPPAKKAK